MEYKLRSIEKQIFPTIRREYLKFFVVYFLIVDFYFQLLCQSILNPAYF